MSKSGRKDPAISESRERLAALRSAYRQAAADAAHAEARLAAGRARALDALGGSRRWSWFRPASLAAGIGIAAALMIFVLLPGNTHTPSADGTGMQVVLSGQDYALYQNLDFYAWLAMQQPAGHPVGNHHGSSRGS